LIECFFGNNRLVGEKEKPVSFIDSWTKEARTRGEEEREQREEDGIDRSRVLVRDNTDDERKEFSWVGGRGEKKKASIENRE